MFQLTTPDSGSPTAELIEAVPALLDQEKHLECRHENSPWAIAQEPLLIIGRQTSASMEDGMNVERTA
jgi:hypothetical protein